MLVKVKDIQRHVDPYKTVVWLHVDPLTLEEVKEAVEARQFCSRPLIYAGMCLPTRHDHIARVAYFVVNSWIEPVDFDLLFSSEEALGPLFDGNHRFAAAIYRGDEFIDVLER